MRHNKQRHCLFATVLLCLFVFQSPVLAVKAKPVEKTEKKEAVAGAIPVAVKDAGKKKKTADTDEILTKEYTDKDFAPKPYEGSYAWDLIKTLLILVLLVGGFYYFFRFVTKKAGIQTVGVGVVNILTAVPLGQNKHLHIVELAGKILVLGVADGGVNLITEITDKNEIDRIRLDSSRVTSAGGKGFHDFITGHLGGILGRVTGHTGSTRPKRFSSDSFEADSGVDLNFLRKQHGRLKNLNGDENE